MKLITGFINWLKGLSVKTTVVLTGVGITLFLAMQQSFIGSMASGMAPSDIYAMAFILWLTIIIVTIVLCVLLLLVSYIVHNANSKIKTMIKKNKKQ